MTELFDWREEFKVLGFKDPMSRFSICFVMKGPGKQASPASRTTGPLVPQLSV